MARIIRRKAIHASQSRRVLPVWSAITVWLLLDRLQPPGWVLGVVWTVWGLLALACVIDFFLAQDVKVKDEALEEPRK